MSKRLVLLFCALFVFAAAMPAFAAVQNIKVSGDILARFIARNDFDLAKDTAGTDDNIHVFNTVTRIRIDADLTDNVSTVVRLINERNWNEADQSSNRTASIDNTNDTNIQLDLAYVTLKEFLCSPLTLTIGRQELHFGNDMIIGDGVGTVRQGITAGGIGTNQSTNYREATGYQGINGDLSLRKAFDAIRATLNYDPLVIDLVYAKIRDNVVIDGSTNDDMDLYGINAGYKFSDKWNTMAEGYFWSKRNKGSVVTGTDSLGYATGWQKGKGDDVQVVGARVSTNPIKQINLQQEFAFQFGERVDPSTGLMRQRSAFASQSMAMYTPGWKYQPTMGLIYSYFSGEANPSTSKKYHAWDPMFENQTAGSIINALYPQTNAHNLDAMVKMNPMEDVWLQADYIVQLLARGTHVGGGLIDIPLSDYSPAADLTGGNDFKDSKRFLGQELDLNLTYNYTEDVQLGLLMGWFWPGTALAKMADDIGGGGPRQRQTASEAIASCKVSF